ncbi:3-ketoacyl-ACP reductase [Acrocarpospora pleiomorpha]|uniref:3-ketoacyl-ACP reductase n=1 Tax=Acrocarpospora pleiomorpha TaxID=90975 RepID=A0A5M3XUN7_9ACTN|nr:SDR family NAD(P)-dependent oxidoreductase [Acrocarpospora pleiomorpha]GES24935.1 3-ketoacyl-ACP reductase [Acrocarpospora pleiomorpha]
MTTTVITGAGGGIGRAIATELADRGHRVVVTDVDLAAAEATVAQLSTQHVADHWARRLDVRDPRAAATVAEEVDAAHGLDAWVNNAGISAMVPFLDVEPAQVERTLSINLAAVFTCGQAAARVIARRGGGRIVNIASMAGKQGRVPYLSDYVASKFGVIGLTQAMAFELAEVGIRVNSVCPGYVATPMQDRELIWEASLRDTTTEAVRDLYLRDTPLRRLEEPRDVAKVVAFLLSDDAEFITGEAIAVNGGAFMD